MKLSPYQYLDTPSLLINLDRVKKNIDLMQEKASEYAVKLRPHTKTHKMPELAEMQIEAGAHGITVAKIGEAEVMFKSGIRDIFIANQIVGRNKIQRVRCLAEKAHIIVGADNKIQIEQLENALRETALTIDIRIEVEAGENRSGVILEEQAVALAKYIDSQKHLVFDGIFCHEGHTYESVDLEDCRQKSAESQKRMLCFADVIRNAGITVNEISIGATPSMLTASIMEGITEIRPGTYILLDAAQGNLLNSYDNCAATILATVVSKPTEDRIILDSGAKALTAQVRTGSLCATSGYGILKGSGGKTLAGVFDEHGIIMDKELSGFLSIGDKIEIIPNHICPAVNLYDEAYLVSKGEFVKALAVSGRGKIR